MKLTNGEGSVVVLIDDAEVRVRWDHCWLEEPDGYGEFDSAWRPGLTRHGEDAVLDALCLLSECPELPSWVRVLIDSEAERLHWKCQHED